MNYHKILLQTFRAALMMVLLVGCSSPAPELPASTPYPAYTPSPAYTPILPTDTSIPSTATPEPSMPLPTPDLTTRPQIWFGPLDPSPPDASRPFSGLEFFDLFDEDAAWANAAKRTQAFKLYGGWVAWVASNAELRQVVDYANRHGMALAFEAGPLTPTDECTGEIEGFAGPEEAIRIVQKIKAAGGRIVFVDLEHPYDAATFANAPGSCGMMPEEIAQNVSRFIGTVRSVFPDARFGAVETAQHDVFHVSRWVEAYRAVMGEDLAYFHLDLDYGQPDWPQRALEIETYLRSQGIEFGLFYLGNWQDASDEEWVARAEDRFVAYEVEYDGHPDHVVFQSWHPHPQQLLPETDPSAFTYLINRYTRPRTELTLATTSSLDGSPTLSGVLLDANARPMSDASILLSMKPVEGQGLPFEYTLTGFVPAGATEADVGYRVNLECDCSAPADLVLYEVRYTEGDETTNRIPNSDFSQGYDGWGAWGDAVWKLELSDQGTGRAHHMTALPDQGAAINSAKFPTTAGSSFTMIFVARVSPETLGSGHFNLIFDNGIKEIKRYTIALEPAVIALGEVTTDENGVYSFDLDEMAVSNVALQAWYSGDQDYWPAFASAIFGSH
jgi:hypothetical protein